MRKTSCFALLVVFSMGFPLKANALFGGTDKPRYASTDETCFIYDQYLVQNVESPDDGGNGIKVGKHKAASKTEANNSCGISQADQVLSVDPDMGQRFEGLWKNFLFVGIGTSSDDQGFEVYDLQSAKRVWSGDYKPVEGHEEPVISQNGALSFFEFQTGKPKKTCPAHHLAVEKVSVDIWTGKKATMGDTRCAYVE